MRPAWLAVVVGAMEPLLAAPRDDDVAIDESLGMAGRVPLIAAGAPCSWLLWW